MKFSKTALRYLTARYRAVLLACIVSVVTTPVWADVDVNAPAPTSEKVTLSEDHTVHGIAYVPGSAFYGQNDSGRPIWDLNGHTLHVNGEAETYYYGASAGWTTPGPRGNVIYTAATDYFDGGSFTGGGTLKITSDQWNKDEKGNDVGINAVTGKITIDVDNLDIDVTGYGFYTVGGGTANITADNITMKTGKTAFFTAGGGQITVNAQNLTIYDSEHAFRASQANDNVSVTVANDATVNAQKNIIHAITNNEVNVTIGGKANLKGDMTVGSDAEASLSITGKESLFEGKIATEETGVSALTLNNEAIWKATGDSNVANLMLDGGKVDLNSKTVDVTTKLDATNATFTGGALNLKNAAMNVKGDLTLDGGITGNGTITFDKDATLTAILDTTKIQASEVKTNGAALNLLINGGAEIGEHEFVTADTIDQSFTIGDNTLYNLTMDTTTGKINVASKSAAEVVESSGVGSNESAAISAIAGTAVTGNAQVDNVLNLVTTAMQTGDVATAESVVQQINPVVAPVTQAISTSTAVLGAAMTRMANLTVAPTSAIRTGRSGGDVTSSKLAPWIQGVYSKTHNSQGIGFNAYSQGFAFGADTDLNDDWTVGLGYAYTATDIKDSVRKTQAYGDNVFAYAQYKPSDWYVNGVLNYGHTNYKEKSALVGADYSIDTYGAQVMAGYEWNILNNYAGVRYTYIDMDKYTNGVTEIDTKDAQVATAVIGTKVSKDFTFGKNAILTPEFRVAGTYDFKSDNSSTNVGIVGTQSMYTVNGKRLSRAAVETGVGLTAAIDNWELSLNYDAALRSENNTQSGMFKLKYNF